MSYTLKHKPSTNTAAVATFAAVTGVVKTLDSIQWSYSAAPTGGNLKVESPSGTVIFEQDVTAAGPGQVLFPGGLDGASGQAVIVTLAAGGSGIQGIVDATIRGATPFS